MSADVYSDIMSGLGSKNYPKMTPKTSKLAHRIKSYSQNFEMVRKLAFLTSIRVKEVNYMLWTLQ